MERLAQGESLNQICQDKALPSRSTVYNWIDDNADLLDKYTRARERQADFLADEIVKIADNPEGDWQRDRLRVEARKWTAAKLRPRKYGERVTHAGDKDNPITTRELSDTEYARRIAYTLQRATRGPEAGTEGTDAEAD